MADLFQPVVYLTTSKVRQKTSRKVVLRSAQTIWLNQFSVISGRWGGTVFDNKTFYLSDEIFCLWPRNHYAAEVYPSRHGQVCPICISLVRFCYVNNWKCKNIANIARDMYHKSARFMYLFFNCFAIFELNFVSQTCSTRIRFWN